MDKKKTDPRIIRTRQLLKDAFVELLEEKGIEKITVNRLAERATINRVTFYLHYQDIPDMVEKMADEMIKDILIIINQSNLPTKSSGENNEKIMVRFLEYIAENASFYKVVLTSKSLSIFREQLLLFLTEKIISSVENKGEESPILKKGIQKDILIWYDSSALMGIIVAWLKNDMPYTPSFLAKQFYLIHRRGMDEE